MKQIILILSCLAIFGCSKNDSGIDPNRAIIFQGEVETRSMSLQDSIHRVVEYCYDIAWRQCGDEAGTFLGNGENFLVNGGIIRDLENDRIVMMGNRVLYTVEWSDEIFLGTFIKDTVSVRDVVFVGAVDSVTNELIDLREGEWSLKHKFYRDTLAYIPNKILIAAQKGVLENYNAGNYEACYEIFDNAFVFKPITGARWRALKAAGIE